MRITMKEIAERAGVHRATVDKVLHNRPGVSDAVREKVRRIIEETGYEANPIGKALQRGGALRLAAILLTVDARAELEEGLRLAAADYQKFGLTLEVKTVSHHDPEKEAALLAALPSEGFAGAVIVPLRHPAVERELRKLSLADFPVVTLNVDTREPASRLAYVGQDLRKAGRTAGRVASLLLGGEGRAAIVGSTSFLLPGDREEGIREYLKRFSRIELLPTIETEEDEEKARALTKTLIEDEAPELIFATSGNVAAIGETVAAAQHPPCLISYEQYPEIKALIAKGVISCSITSDLVGQGRTALKLLFEKTFLDISPRASREHLPIGILFAENL